MKNITELYQSSRDLFFDPFTIKDFIDQEEHQRCLQFFDNSPISPEGTHASATRKGSQMLADHGPSEMKEIFMSKLNKVFPDKHIVVTGSNFTTWHSPVKVHTDGFQPASISQDEIERSQEVLGFAVLVPLRTDTNQGQPATVFFDQRYFGPNINSPTVLQMDKTLIDNFTHKEFDKNNSEYHRINHLSDEMLFGFSINKILEWGMRDAIIWHRAQFHGSTKFQGFNNKTHLVFLCNFV